MVKGCISKIEDPSFGANGGKAGQSTSASYTDAQRVQGPGLATGVKIAIGVAIGLRIVAIIFGARCARSAYCG